MEDWQTSPLILFLCGVGLFILGFIFTDAGFGIYGMFFIGASMFAVLLADSGGAT